MTASEPAEHPQLPAGYTYLGQFIAHDLTFNPASASELQNDPQTLHNFRTPALDLDSLYGRGPELQPYLYRRDKPPRFLLGKGMNEWNDDLPRNHQGLALAADPRNDENLILSQLSVLFLLAHNQLARRAENREGLSGGAAFQRARTLLQWHYQWVVLNDYLPRVLHPTVLARLAPVEGPKRLWTRACLCHFSPTTSAYIPVEFAAAAYRFGHSLIREGYHLNAELSGARNGLELPIFDETGDDLRGGRRLPAGWHLEWADFLTSATSRPQRAGLFDTQLARPLSRVPLPAGRILHLAQADLELGQVLALPSGQALSRAMGIEVLTPTEVQLAGAAGRDTPLWYYVLKEAEIQQQGRTLGLLGSEIVGEVLVGLVRLDRFSYLSLDPDWRPPLAPEGEFRLWELAQMAWES